MLRWILCCFLATAALAVDELETPLELPPEPAPAQPEETPAPATPAAKPTPAKQLNTRHLAALRAFAQKRGLATSESGGTGPVRMIALGASKLDGAALTALGTQTLRGLEQWSGGNHAFLPEPMPEGEVLWLTVFANDGDYGAWVDVMQSADRRAMVKQSAGFAGSRMLFARASAVERMAENWAVYSTAVMAIDAFFADRGGKAPAWIRESTAAEAQRLLCKGRIICATMAYEQNKEKRLIEGWGKEVARMLQQRDKTVLRAMEIMRTDVNAVAPATYYQQWSLGCYLREVGGQQRGAQNGWLRLLTAVAGGQESWEAVRDVLRMQDPALSQNWATWALTQAKR